MACYMTRMSCRWTMTSGRDRREYLPHYANDDSDEVLFGSTSPDRDVRDLPTPKGRADLGVKPSGGARSEASGSHSLFAM